MSDIGNQITFVWDIGEIKCPHQYLEQILSAYVIQQSSRLAPRLTFVFYENHSFGLRNHLVKNGGYQAATFFADSNFAGIETHFLLW